MGVAVVPQCPRYLGFFSVVYQKIMAVRMAAIHSATSQSYRNRKEDSEIYQCR
jgi:hypothetical protein